MVRAIPARISCGSPARHGLIDGKNVRVEMRLAEGRLERLPEFAKALVRDGATVLLAYGPTNGQHILFREDQLSHALPMVEWLAFVADAGHVIDRVGDGVQRGPAFRQWAV
jgi:hypothetical protein